MDDTHPSSIGTNFGPSGPSGQVPVQEPSNRFVQGKRELRREMERENQEARDEVTRI